MSNQTSEGPMHCVVGRINICGHYFPKRISTPVDNAGCILPDGHEGSHLFKADDKKFYSWKWDFCGCPGCMSEDSMDQCCVYSEALPPNTPIQRQAADGDLGSLAAYRSEVASAGAAGKGIWRG